MNHFLTLKRNFYQRRVEHEWLRSWLCAPLPSSSLNAEQARYLVVDLELTGLDPKRDKIVSMGWVAINDGVVSVNSSQHYFIKLEGSVGHSATIHQIRDVDLNQGISLQQGLELLLKACKNRVVVFHSAWLDYGALTNACKSIFDIPFLTPVVDTLQLEKQNIVRTYQPISNGGLRLAACRERYNLPFYPGHNALIDALATAELLLAILAKKNQPTLGSVLA